MTDIKPELIERACEAYRRPNRMLTNDSATRHHDCMAAALEAVADELRAEGGWSATSCTCTWHPGSGTDEPPSVEYQPNCPEHSDHLWDPKGQMWVFRSDLRRDDYHTMDELYEYRMLYNALAANAMPDRAVKSWRHSDGEECFGGGWFVVYLNLPTGQVSNHYKAEHWNLFQIPEVDIAPEWDGHTPRVAAERLYGTARADRIEAGS